MGRQKLNISIEEKKRLKAEYDREYRAKNRATIKKKKAAYFQLTYDPVKAAIERKKNMPRHVEYCRHPKYKAYKKEYDKNYRAKKNFGEYAESALLLNELESLINWRQAKQDNNIYNKSQKRKRSCQKQS